MRAHRRVATRDVLGQRQASAGGRPAPRARAPAPGARRWDAAPRARRLRRWPLAGRRAIALEQAQQRRGDGAQVVAARGGHLQQLGAGGHDLGQRVGAAMRARRACAPPGPACGSGPRSFAAVVAAQMRGHLLDAIEDAHAPIVGQHRQRAPHMGVRHRVVVQIEAHVGRLAHLHGQAFAQRVLAAGRASRRGCSTSKASRTLSGLSSGQRRSDAWPSHQTRACAFRSSRSVNSRAAKKALRT